MPSALLLSALATLTHAASLLILADVIASWGYALGWRAAAPYAPWVRTLHRFTDPMLRPIRALLPARGMGGLDISPMIALIILQFLAEALATASRSM